jgi:hypothetical protein
MALLAQTKLRVAKHGFQIEVPKNNVRTKFLYLTRKNLKISNLSSVNIICNYMGFWLGPQKRT